MLEEQRRGQSPNTLQTQRYTCLRFLRYLEQRGITSREFITPEVVIEFHLTDEHDTSEGKKAYNSKISRFLRFLGEQKQVPEPLCLALPCKIAQKAAIVKILSETEIHTLYSAKDKAVAPINLCDVAIVMLGLRMGLRAGDIVSLKYTDISCISWARHTITITQNKTGLPLTLPMPIEVGNSLFRYLKQGRPKIQSELVFVLCRPPFGKLNSLACADALNRMLRCKRNGKQRKYGSHILRKTFASRTLVSGASVDAVANLLGHRRQSTVMTSTDDDRMRLCAIHAGKVVSA